MPGPARRWAIGLGLGPAAFVGAWALGGLRMPDPYSPVHDAISRLAAVGSPERGLMSAGFVAYGVAVVAGSQALRHSPLRRAWPAAVVNGLATLAVAATPLDRSDLVDQLHGVSATVGYASIVALPLLAARPLRELGHRRAAAASVALAAVSATCLVATVVAEQKGLAQRVGLGAGDVWLVAASAWLVSRKGSLAGRPDRAGRAEH